MIPAAFPVEVEVGNFLSMTCQYSFILWAPTDMIMEKSQNCSGSAAMGFFQIFSWQPESSSCSYEEPICFCWSLLGRKVTCLKIISKGFLKSRDTYGVGSTWNSKKSWMGMAGLCHLGDLLVKSSHGELFLIGEWKEKLIFHRDVMDRRCSKAVMWFPVWVFSTDNITFWISF